MVNTLKGVAKNNLPACRLIVPISCRVRCVYHWEGEGTHSVPYSGLCPLECGPKPAGYHDKRSAGERAGEVMIGPILKST
ncbi:hypothetical protein Metal_0849 [Methylomicrobium album BG8]|uniref:Uncharacterized protein n=1 Tax=Methylomicrobium album BG8 TaxID=686340 RepID=H8GR19_METAL|nr:hypothetical protein Metal_0849 [Methylomicrobium album BG8]